MLAYCKGDNESPGFSPEATSTHWLSTSFCTDAVVLIGALAANVAGGIVKPVAVVVRVALAGTEMGTGGAITVSAAATDVEPPLVVPVNTN